MTGRFETLIYTDCRPGQGLRGSAGLQFQARSAQPAADAEPVVQRHLLYEPPSRWMADRRPVEQYPPSFGHVCADGFYATAAGCYLGREANGSREGNQLTHSIVTRDPGAYAGLRPAQLFGAQFWRRTPADGTTCAPLEPGWTVDALPPKQARDFVLSQPDGAKTLLALVSALETAGQPHAPRVLFVSADVSRVLHWLIAGTLLVPQGRALELGFKVFTTGPANAGLPVVAVHPEWSGSAGRLDNDLGYAVFDLERGEHSPVAETDSAVRWVEMFFAEDPRDVVDALDVAAVSGLAANAPPGPAANAPPGPATNAPPGPGTNAVPGPGTNAVPGPAANAVAASLGVAAIMHKIIDPRHAESIVGWLRTGPEALRAAYATDIAELFAQEPEVWPQRVLVLLDEVGCDGLVPGKAGRVRLALIHSEVDQARRNGGVADRLLPKLPTGEWLPEHVVETHRLIIEAISSRITPTVFDALLRVATRFRVQVRYADISTVGHAFVKHWADHPQSRYRPALWPCGPELEDALLDELRFRAGNDPGWRATLGDGWWRWLLPKLTELGEPLAEVTLGAAVWHSEQRAEFVERQLHSAGDRPGAYAWLVGALFSRAQPTLDELRLVASLAPHRGALPQHVFHDFVGRLLGTGRLDPVEVELCAELIERTLLQPGAELADLLRADDELIRATRALLTRAVPFEDDIGPALHRICESPPRLVVMRESMVVAALLRVLAGQTLVKVLSRHRSVEAAYLVRLADALRTRDDVRYPLVGVYLAMKYLNRDHVNRNLLLEAVDHWIVRSSDRSIQVVRHRLAEMGDDWAKRWDIMVDRVHGRRRRYRLTHPFGGKGS